MEYGAFLDARDAASACFAGLPCRDPSHGTALVCAEDLSTSGPTEREHASRLLPDVPWRGGETYDGDPYRTLLDTRRARERLGLRARYGWRDGVDAQRRMRDTLS